MELKIILHSTVGCDSIAAPSLQNADLGYLFATLSDVLVTRATLFSLVAAQCTSGTGATSVIATVELDVTLSDISDGNAIRIEKLVPSLPNSVSGIALRSWVTRLASAAVTNIHGNCHASCRTCVGTGVNQCSSCASNATLSTEVTGQGMCVPNELVTDDGGWVVAGSSASRPVVTSGGVAAIVVVLLLIVGSILVVVWKRRQLQSKLRNTPKLHKYIPARIRGRVLGTPLPVPTAQHDEGAKGREDNIIAATSSQETGTKGLGARKSSSQQSNTMLLPPSAANSANTLAASSSVPEPDSLVVAVEGETAKRSQERKARGVRKTTGRVRSSAHVSSGKRIRLFHQSSPAAETEPIRDVTPESVDALNIGSSVHGRGPNRARDSSAGSGSESDHRDEETKIQLPKLLMRPTESQEQQIIEHVRSLVDKQLAKAHPNVLARSGKEGGIRAQRRQFVRAEPPRTNTLGTKDSHATPPPPRSILRRPGSQPERKLERTLDSSAITTSAPQEGNTRPRRSHPRTAKPSAEIGKER
jgi:hypothetical protein